MAQRKPTDAVPQAAPSEGQELYLRLVTQELTGWSDPRAMLHHALQNNQFLLLAQKIAPLKRDVPEPVCYEMLLRLKQEEDHLLPPGGFLDLADSIGMMDKIDHWVVRTLLAWCVARLKGRSSAALPMLCINLSTAAICSPQFVRVVRDTLAKSGVPGRALCFEVNERDVLDHHGAVRELATSLKPAGCRFTVDGFGSAKVSFTHLKGLAVDFVKIDGIIVQGIAEDPLMSATAKAINIVCHELGIRTIAECVETRKTLEKLRELAVDYVQGFGIARPEPITRIP